MSTPIPNLDEHPATIVQEELDIGAAAEPLRVVTINPVQVQVVPARAAGFFQYSLTTTAAVRVLERDPRRKRAVLIAHDNTDAGTAHGVFLGGSQAEALSPYAFELGFITRGTGLGASSGPMEITAIDEVWASAAIADCILSVMNEQWAY
jgi:hypothetical protein